MISGALDSSFHFVPFGMTLFSGQKTQWCNVPVNSTLTGLRHCQVIDDLTVSKTCQCQT